MTDFRALCTELLQAADTLLGQGESPANPGQRLIPTVHLEDLEDCANRARAELAQPEPQGPTDEEIAECLIDAGVDTMEGESDGTGRTYWEGWHDQVMAGVRAALARWGRPAIEPVPVSERFEFSVFDSEYEEQAGGTAPTYSQALSEGQHYLAMYSQDGPHSLEIRRVEVLPHHALPVPGVEGADD